MFGPWNFRRLRLEANPKAHLIVSQQANDHQLITEKERTRKIARARDAFLYVRPNEEFSVMLKRKVRLPLWPSEHLCCTCGKMVNAHGDRVTACTKHHKTQMHDNTKNGLCKRMKKVCMTVKLTAI